MRVCETAGRFVDTTTDFAARVNFGAVLEDFYGELNREDFQKNCLEMFLLHLKKRLQKWRTKKI